MLIRLGPLQIRLTTVQKGADSHWDVYGLRLADSHASWFSMGNDGYIWLELC